MTKQELINKLNTTPGKQFVADGYVYTYTLLRKQSGEEITAIARYPQGSGKRMFALMEVLYEAPGVRI